jgi:hypothetical protein
MRTNNATFTLIDEGSSIIDDYEEEINIIIHDIQFFRFNYHEEMTSLPF